MVTIIFSLILKRKTVSNVLTLLTRFNGNLTFWMFQLKQPHIISQKIEKKMLKVETSTFFHVP